MPDRCRGICAGVLAGVLLATTAACAHDGAAAPGPSASSNKGNDAMPTITTQFATTVIEGRGARLEVDFDQGSEDVVQVRYRLHNTGDADLAVFDRGDRHAVLTGRLDLGTVPAPLFRDEGEGDYTFGHVALPLPTPSPASPPTPLAARLAAGQLLEGGFTLSVPGEVPRRARWCLGMAPFDEELFDQSQQAGGVEVWRGSFAAVQTQQKLCTPWYDMVAGVFKED